MDPGLEVVRADLRAGVPDGGESGRLATALEAGALLEARLTDAAGAAALAAELDALQRSAFDPERKHYVEILVAEDGAVYGWGVEDDGGTTRPGARRLDLAATPRLAGVVARVRAISDARRAPDERFCLAAYPSLRRVRTFPRYFHRDSYAPVVYRTVWDVGLENSSDVFGVVCLPAAALEVRPGEFAKDYEHLKQRHEIPDFHLLSEDEIEAIQPQMREEMLPWPPPHAELEPGLALAWRDDLFYHSVYLRRGRRREEVEERPRSILILREIAGNSFRQASWTPPVEALLPPSLARR
jgi:hypothetical protein